MRLQDDARDPVSLWQYAERYLGVGTRTYSPYAADLDIADDFHPQRGPGSFRLPTFRVPAPLGGYLRSGVSSALHGLYASGDGVLLPVHPNALDHPDLFGREELLRCPAGPELTVVPSANARTVFVTERDGVAVPPHFVKLHYPRRLSRFTRRLRRPVIELQLWVSDELVRVGVPVLPEVGGGWFGPVESPDAWGFLVRSARPLDAAPRFTVPLFALYGGDLRAPGDPTLLEQLVAAWPDDPAVFVAERIVVPMVRLWVKVARETGCPLETHGQNTLFAFDPATLETRVLYRDCAIYVDSGLRERAGLAGPLPPANVIPRDVPLASDEVFSLTYDSFMGHHALSYVAAVARDRLGVDVGALRAAARAAFTAADLLPSTVFYYDNTLYENGDWKLVDTGRAPVWR